MTVAPTLSPTASPTFTPDPTYHVGMGLVLVMLVVIVFVILMSRSLVDQEIRYNQHMVAMKRAAAVVATKGD